MNILFIMADQLRYDYLGCTGHPYIRTPNIDALARRGVRFDNAYVQSPICGPSRMSFYTGRYARSHGSTWNDIPLKIGELTLGDHLRPLGMDAVLCGKSHMAADKQGMERLGLDPESLIGVRAAECGFDIWDRHDGEIPMGVVDKPNEYQDYLRGLGYDGPNPWEQWANSAEGDDGEILSGWLMSHASQPARVKEEHSETPYTTTRAMEFIDQAGDNPWCLHVSYIKPHWPYIVPEPYHELYSKDDVIPVIRSEAEKDNPHPLLQAYYKHRFCKVFERDEVRETVIPAYMGLITQLDDQIGRLMQHLENTGQIDNTLIVFTSDHGDYLGDHWLGEKELFHEQSVKIPLIIVDPRKEADISRGKVTDALVEAIDLVPTFVEIAGGKPRPEILEGYSLLPLIREETNKVRDFVISEYDYMFKGARHFLNQPIADCRLAMVFDGRYKLVHAEGFRPLLYDLEEDPQEFVDQGDNPQMEQTRDELLELLHSWYRRHHTRTTISEEEIEARVGGDIRKGLYVGFWNEEERAEADKLGRSGN